MKPSSHKPLPSSLILFLLVYATASLFHHIHNAEFLTDYPNLPTWLTRSGVYFAWFLTTLVGVIGYWMVHKQRVRAGLWVLLAYAALGLYGLAHYAVAPPQAHGIPMNLSIGLEVAAASLLLLAVGRQLQLIHPLRYKG